MDTHRTADIPYVYRPVSTQTRLRSRTRRRLYRNRVSTQTVLALFIGLFVTYGSYFILTASGDDRSGGVKVSNEQPGSQYRSEVVPIELPPEEGARGAEPARGAILEDAGKVAAEEPASGKAGTLPAGIERPGDHLSAPPEPVRDEVEDEGESEEEERVEVAESVDSATPSEKRGLLRRLKGALSRKGSRKGAEPAVAESEDADEETPIEITAEAKGPEGAEDTKVEAEAAKPKSPVAAAPAAEEAEEDSAFAFGRVKTIQDAENTVTLRSGPSPQDKMCRTFIFDASKSYDPDDDNLSYEWDFGDESPKSTDIRVRHTFPKAGDYKVTLTVTDNTKGECSVSKTQQVVSANRAPIAVGVFPVKLIAGQTGIFDGRLSEDTPGDRLSFEWDFGDGNKVSGPVVPYRFMEPGEYRVVLTVKDSSKSNCDTSVVASGVLVEKPLQEEKLFALEPPEALKPRLRESIPLEEIPPFEVKEIGKTELDGLLGQVREHEGEEEPAPEIVEVEEKVEVKVTKPKLPVRLVSAETPIPERPPEPSAPRFLPDTHRYVLAWAGGYLVHCPTVGCGTENRVAFRSRMERDLNRLLHTVIEDRDRIREMMESDSNQEEILKAHEQNITMLGDRIGRFRQEALDANSSQVGQVSSGLRDLTQEVELSHQKLLAMSSRNADRVRRFAGELVQHAQDDSRHKSPFDQQSPGKSQTSTSRSTNSVSIPEEE